jgi:hypothetical protein
VRHPGSLRPPGPDGVWHSDALRLHIDAIALLNQRIGAAPAEDDVVLSRLRNMRRAIGVSE